MECNDRKFRKRWTRCSQKVSGNVLGKPSENVETAPPPTHTPYFWREQKYCPPLWKLSKKSAVLPEVGLPLTDGNKIFLPETAFFAQKHRFWGQFLANIHAQVNQVNILCLWGIVAHKIYRTLTIPHISFLQRM